MVAEFQPLRLRVRIEPALYQRAVGDYERESNVTDFGERRHVWIVLSLERVRRGGGGVKRQVYGIACFAITGRGFLIRPAATCLPVNKRDGRVTASLRHTEEREVPQRPGAGELVGSELAQGRGDNEATRFRIAVPFGGEDDAHTIRRVLALDVKTDAGLYLELPKRLVTDRDTLRSQRHDIDLPPPLLAVVRVIVVQPAAHVEPGTREEVSDSVLQTEPALIEPAACRLEHGFSFSIQHAVPPISSAATLSWGADGLRDGRALPVPWVATRRAPAAQTRSGLQTLLPAASRTPFAEPSRSSTRFR